MALEPYLNLPESGQPDEEFRAPDVKKEAAEMLQQSPVAPRAAAPGGPRIDDSAFFKDFAAPKPPAPKEGILTGFMPAIAGGAAELGHQATGALNWAAERTLEPTNPIRQGISWANQTAGQSAQDWQETLSPEDRDLMARHWTTLDPHQTIWQGGAHDFVHALTLQMANAAPSALTMLLPMGVMAKAGMVNGALAYVGATQTGLSIGQISNNIEQEIASRDDNTLRQSSPDFAHWLDSGMDPAQAREKLNAKGQQYAPLLGGLASGAIATLAGRYLTPVITGAAGAGLLKRAGLGFLDQAAQGAGIGATNYVASETAAHVYDSGRAPDLVGGLHAAGEAAAAQGALGAAIAGAHGRSQPLPSRDLSNAPDIHAPMTSQSPENKATGAATENHVTNLHADETPDTSQWEGEGGNTGAQPYNPVVQPGQIPLDLHGALEAHYNPDALKGEANYREQPPYRGAPPPDEGPPGPGPGGSPADQALVQEQLPLRGGMNPAERPGPTPPAIAQNLETPLQRNLPLEPTMRARGGVNPPPPVEPARPQTVADQLRERAAGNQDWNQPDLLRENQPVGPTQGGRSRLSLPQNRPEVQGNPEGPGARPFKDVATQIQELNDPQHLRQGIFINADTMASLRRSGLLERVRDHVGPEAVPLADFDHQGGALIAKNEAAAQELTHLRDTKAATIPEILEHATGESQAAPGPAEVLRRSRLTGLEHEAQTRTIGERETGNAVRRAAERIPNETVSQRVRAAAARDLATGEASPAINPEEAARRMTAEAQAIHDETRTRSRSHPGVLDPGDVEFGSERLQEHYRDLYDEFVSAKTPLDRDVAERGAVEFLDRYKPKTTARHAAEAAHEVSPTGVREFLENKRQAGRRRVEPLERVTSHGVEPLPRPTRAELRMAPIEEVQSRYHEVLDRAGAADKRWRLSDFMSQGEIDKAGEGDRELTKEELKRMNISKERQVQTAEEMKLADRTDARGMVHDEPLRSLMEKRINRWYRNEAERKSYGPGKSDRMAVSPRRALTEKQIEENKTKAPGAKHLGFKTFDPKSLFADVKSQKEMESSTQTRAQYDKVRSDLKSALHKTLRLGEKSAKEMSKVETPLTAKHYLRQILQFGRALRDGPLNSTHSLTAAKQFIRHIEALAQMPPDKRAAFMDKTFRTELERQQLRGAGANPERANRLETMHEEIGEHEMPTGEGGEQMRIGIGEKYAAPASHGHPLALPLEERGQPKFGYQGAQKHPDLTPAEIEEMRTLINKTGPKQYKLALRGGQAEPQGTTHEVSNLSQWQNTDAREGRLSTEDHSVHVAASAIGKMFEENPVIRGPQIIRSLLNNLLPGSAAHDLASNLRAVIKDDTLIGWGREREFVSPSAYGQVTWHADGPQIRLNRDHFDYIRAQGIDPRGELVTTLLHEFSHVATIKRLMTDSNLRASIEALRTEALKHGGLNEWNGLKNVAEFVADGYSDPKFREFLRGIETPGGKNLWERFKDLARHAIAFVKGQDFQPKTKNLLDTLMEHHNEMWTGEKYTTKGATAVKALMREDVDGKHVGNMADRSMQAMDVISKTRNYLADKWSELGQTGLSAMTPRQMDGQFSKYFDHADGSNPYRGYWDAYHKRAADNAVSMGTVSKRSVEWSRLEERYGPDTMSELSRIMRVASTYGFHPDLAASAADNSHVIGENLARAETTRTEFKALPEEVQAQYEKMKQYYKDEQRNSTDQLVLNGLHAMLTKGDDAAMTPKMFDEKYDAAAVRRLELDTTEGLQKEFGDKLSGANQDLLAKMGQISKSKGPYFPLMRNGDYVVTAKRQIANKEFATSAEAQAYAREQRGNDATLAVKVNHDGEEGTYHVSVTEREVRMAESKSEAAAHQKDMANEYGEENTSPVQLKADLYQGQSSITTGSALDRLVQKLEGNPAAQAAIKDFYLRSLGEQSFRKRELARQNWRGVSENQHRSFVNYGRSQAYWLSQLKWGRHLANALADVHKDVRAHRDESQVSAVRMGQFAKELALRDEISRSPYEVGKLVQKGTAITQVMMLTSPSHWFVRGIQPLTLTAPWLGARHGLGESVAALARAQNMIRSPLLTETTQSALGFKALWNKFAAEKTYSVMDSVMSHLAATGADPKINEMLEGLRNNSLIDISMATELSDIGAGRSSSYFTQVKDASRGMLHLLEVNNRAMTAIAARELGLKAGMTEEQARAHAADAINVTHNDYSYANTPRLFMAQAKGLTGGLRPLIFQFMKYPQQVYGMMASSAISALKGKTRLEQQQGLKTFVGVMATHMLAAGAIGASIAPMKWAIGAGLALASAAGMTDKNYTLANALSGDTYDHLLREASTDLFGTDIGELLAKGVPAALGVDLSQRMALGSTYQFHLKTDSDASTLGSLLETFGGPWLNVAENFYDAGKSILGGDVVKGIQQASPHILRDMIKAGVMTEKGVMNNAGTTLIPADKLSGPQLFAQAAGFRPEHIAEVQDRNNAERTALADVQDTRKSLIQKYVSTTEPSERQAVWNKVKEFNQAHPGFALTYSTLHQATVAQQEKDREMQQYGVRLKGKQLPEITREGEPYNVQ